MNIIVRFWIYLASAILCSAATAPGFKVSNKYPVPGDGGFDYIVFDSSSNRLYVSHGTEVDVLDADSGKVLGKVEDTPGVHGIAIVPNLHRGFTTNGGDGTVSAFDTDTFKTLKRSRFQKIRTLRSTIRKRNEYLCAMETELRLRKSILRGKRL